MYFTEDFQRLEANPGSSNATFRDIGAPPGRFWRSEFRLFSPPLPLFARIRGWLRSDALTLLPMDPESLDEDVEDEERRAYFCLSLPRRPRGHSKAEAVEAAEDDEAAEGPAVDLFREK